MVDRNYIISISQQIVDKAFSSTAERKIHQHENRLNLRCPYCLEGRTISKKRGNIYLDKLIYVCFRCGKKTNFDRLSKDFNIRLDPDKKMEMIEHLSSNISYKDAEDDFLDTEFNKLLNLEDVVRIFNNNENVITDFNPVKKDGIIYNYLVNRGIGESLHQNIYEGKYWMSSERYEPVLVLLNKRGNKVLGAQVRNIKDGKKRLFKIYNYETLYKWINAVDEVEDLDINQIVIYNKLSSYFNILNVDFGEKITIFEGYLDSLFYPNSIGIVGVNTDMNWLESNNLNLQYFFDNDSAGFDKSEEKIKGGYPVFLWKKLFQDIVDKKKSDDPYSLMYRISKVKDLNKLSELATNPYKKFGLENFFSQDVLDLRWIPKKEKRKFSPVRF